MSSLVQGLSTSRTLRIGLVGAGVMGADHAHTLATSVPGGAVQAVVDFDPVRAADLAHAIGARVADSAEELLADPDIDALVVASPDPTHAPLALAAIEAGKPVLCEKPLGISAEESARVVRAEVAAGRRLVTVGFMRRFDPGYVELRALVAEGALGTPRLVHNVHRNQAAHPSATTDGVIVNSMIHELDVVPWLLDSPVRTIQVASPTSDGLQDPQLAVLTLESGVLATVEVFLNAAYGYDVRCEVSGTGGAAALRAPTRTVRSAAGLTGENVPSDFRPRFTEAYRVELAAWTAGVLAGRQVGPTAWDGHRANLVAAAGVQALHSGTVVEVSGEPRPDLYA